MIERSEIEIFCGICGRWTPIDELSEPGETGICGDCLDKGEGDE